MGLVTSSLKGDKQPKAPDYVATAREQGNQNLAAIRAGAALNRVNQVNPYGSTTYTQDPYNPDSYTQTTTLSPNQQRLLDQSEGLQYNQGQAANSRLNQVSSQDAFTLDGLPSQVTGVQGSNFKTDINAPSIAQTSLDTSSLNDFGRAALKSSVDFSGAPQRADAQYQSNVDLSGVANIPGLDDYSADRQRVEDAYYDRSAKRLDQQFGRLDDQTRTQLLNQGLREGSEGWNRAMTDLSNQRTDAYGDARDRAIQAGGAEQSRMFGDALAGRQQGVNEQFNLGQFTNDAADRSNQYGLAARGQGVDETLAAANFGNQAALANNDQAAKERAQRYSEILQGGQFANDAAGQQFKNETARNSSYNSAQSDIFSQGLTNANLQNQGRATGMQERITERQLPLNEFLSLYSGTPTQVQSPDVPGAGTPQAGDFQTAASQQYGAQAGQYNAQQARNAQNLNSLIQLASLFAN